MVTIEGVWISFPHKKPTTSQILLRKKKTENEKFNKIKETKRNIFFLLVAPQTTRARSWLGIYVTKELV